MDTVRAPLIVDYFQQKTCIVDTGYAWLKQFPAGEHFTVTAQYDSSARIVAWYIDICLDMGVDQNHIPWMDDLYLDLVISPSLEVEVKDADELLAARESGEITASDFDLAWRTADQIIDSITRRQFGLLALSDRHRWMLLSSDTMRSSPYPPLK
jgi:predicted RNA-binding protein associated with RNAse of E/G family